MGTTLLAAELLRTRIAEPFVILNPTDGARMHIQEGSNVYVSLAEKSPVIAKVVFNDNLPERVVLVPRSFGFSINGPVPVEIKLAR
jgi:anaerobic selenocysteine-containing dehydrogenase